MPPPSVVPSEVEPLELLDVLRERCADVAEADRQPRFARQFAERLRRFGVGGEQPAGAPALPEASVSASSAQRGGARHERDVRFVRAREPPQEAREPLLLACDEPAKPAGVGVDVRERIGRRGGEQLRVAARVHERAGRRGWCRSRRAGPLAADHREAVDHPEGDAAAR